MEPAPTRRSSDLGARDGEHRGPSHNFWTWLNDSSTGVSRPKMDTSTCSFCCSALISLIVAGSVANGPSMTVTDSPTSKSTTVVGAAAAAAGLALSATLAACGGGAGGSGVTDPLLSSGGGRGGGP